MIALATLAIILIAIAVIDQRQQIIPDSLNAALLAAGLFYAGSDGLGRLVLAFVSVLGFGLLFAALRWVYARLRKRQGLGWGDVKFLAAAGAWIPPEVMPWVVLLASMSALLYVVLTGFRQNTVNFNGRIPFGPHLAIGLFTAWCLSPYLVF